MDKLSRGNKVEGMRGEGKSNVLQRRGKMLCREDKWSSFQIIYLSYISPDGKLLTPSSIEMSMVSIMVHLDKKGHYASIIKSSYQSRSYIESASVSLVLVLADAATSALFVLPLIGRPKSSSSSSFCSRGAWSGKLLLCRR